ncbi:MAG: ATP-binding protein [Gemmatimonadota bacterium]
MADLPTRPVECSAETSSPALPLVRMTDLPTLRRELIGSFGIVFAGALVFAIAGVVLVVPRLAPGVAAAYVVTLLLADIAIFSLFGMNMIGRRLLGPLGRIVADVEEISRGDLGKQLPPADSHELARLSGAVNQMAKRLIEDQWRLKENIRSLNETNRLLTEARDAMIRTEKMASVGRLGAGIAHEVGNPLGAIMGYLSLLSRGAEGQRAELIQAADREARRIDRIIRGLLDFARPRDAVAQPTDVNRVLIETIELVRLQGHLNGVDLASDLATSPVDVSGDPYQLQQVFVNLLVNAGDALEETTNPQLTIMSVRRQVQLAVPHTPARRKEDPPGIDYSHRRRLAATPRWPEGDPESESGEVIEIIVADNGPGLPPALIDQVFEPFVTTKEPGKGTGLGLALCARLIEAMGGTIHARNGADGGAVFRVILPALPVEAHTT